LRLSTAVGWNERPGPSHAPENPAATQNQSTDRQYPMPAPETRTEHEAKAARRQQSKSRIDAALEHLAARRTTTNCARRAGPAFGTSVMARPEEQLAPYRPSLRLLTPYIVARWPLRFCGPLLPCAEYPGLVKAASHQFHALLQSTWHCRRRAAMQRRARRWVVSCPYGGELT
jgi:hypothetical protein